MAVIALASLGNSMEDPKAVKILVKTMKDKDAAIALRCQAAISIGSLRASARTALSP